MIDATIGHNDVVLRGHRSLLKYAGCDGNIVIVEGEGGRERLRGQGVKERTLKRGTGSRRRAQRESEALVIP